MSNDEDRKRIERLEQRLERVEALLNAMMEFAELEQSALLPEENAAPPEPELPRIQPVVAPGLVPLAPVADAPARDLKALEPLIAAKPPSPLSPAVDAIRASRAEVRRIEIPFDPPTGTAPVQRPVPAPLPAPAVAPRAPEGVKAAEAQRSGGLEQAIGLKWAGWIGAVVLVISAGMGFVYAYQQGWFNNLPPSLKLALMALVGFSVIGVGEFVYRRINQLASTGLFATGVSILFIVAFAGNHYYRLYTPGTAFWVMAMAVLQGVAIAVRGKFMSIATLAIIGGNLVPILLSTGEPPGVTLLVYVLFLQILALAPSYLGREPKWWTLRTLSLITTTLWSLIVLEQRTVGTYVMLSFELLNAALFHAEAVASSARFAMQKTDGILINPARPERTGGVLFCLCVTVVLCGLGLFTLSDEPRHLKTSWVIALALFYGWQGLSLSIWFGETLKPQAEGFKVQSALLMMLAVPVGLRGFWMTGGWGLLALAFVGLGARVKLPAARAFAITTMLLGFAKWFMWDTGFWIFDAGSHAGQDFVFNGYCGAVLILALACAASYLLSKARPPDAIDSGLRAFRFALACSPVALAFWAGSVEIHRYSGRVNPFEWDATGSYARAQFMLTGYWAVLSMALVLAHFALRKSGRILDGHPLRWTALCVLTFAFAKWMLCDALSWALVQATPGVVVSVGTNSFGLVSLMLLVAVIVCALLSSAPAGAADEPAEPGSSENGLTALSACGAVCIFWAGSAEIHRYYHSMVPAGPGPDSIAILGEQLTLTAYWAVLSIVFVVLHFWREKRNAVPYLTAFHSVALGVLFLAGGKWFLVDTFAWAFGDATTPPAGPLVNLFGLDLLLLLAACAANGAVSGERFGGKSSSGFKTVLAYCGAVAIFWAGTWEIHRGFHQLAAGAGMTAGDASLAEQLGLSLFWSVFAMTLIVTGFVFPRAAPRYAGLALFMLTLIKVGIFDLSFLSQGYRILSFAGLGILLLATSVMYGYFSPKLLAKAAGK